MAEIGIVADTSHDPVECTIDPCTCEDVYFMFIITCEDVKFVHGGTGEPW